MALGVELFLLLELTLKGREISLKPLRRETVVEAAGWLGVE